MKSNWNRERLEDVFVLQMGKTPARQVDRYWNNGTKKWVSIADIGKTSRYIEKTKEQITDEAISESGIRQVPANTLIMSFKLSLGKVAITREPLYTNEAIMAFIDRGKYQLSLSFLFHLFKNKDWSDGTNKAVMGITLNKATLKDIVIPIPPLQEQEQIAKKLDAIYNLKSIQEEQLRKLEWLASSRFIEMFGNETKAKVSLGGYSEISGGITKNSRRKNLPLKMPYLRVANVFFNAIDTSELLRIGVTEEEYTKTLLKNNDLLFVEGNGSPDQIGRVALWDARITPCLHQNHLIRVRLDKSFNPYYVLHYFMSQEGRQQIITSAVSTSGLHTLSVGKISKFTLPKPELKKQNEFATFVEQLDKSKVTIRKSIEKLELLYKALLQEYFG